MTYAEMLAKTLAAIRGWDVGYSEAMLRAMLAEAGADDAVLAQLDAHTPRFTRRRMARRVKRDRKGVLDILFTELYSAAGQKPPVFEPDEFETLQERTLARLAEAEKQGE